MLLAHGRSANTPAALIENGSLPSQRVFVTSLDKLSGMANTVALQAPALVIVGEVVSLANAAALTTTLAPGAFDEAA